VVGVRRVRSGGVLGFFATERYVAEVAEAVPDTSGRPAVPARQSEDDAAPADFSSPLASAAPARARAAAPARNGAAAWAAEAAARSTDDIPPEVRAAAAAARAARSAAPAAAPARTAAPAAPSVRTATPERQPVADPGADGDRVSELASLLAAQQADPPAPTYSRATFPRASFPGTGTVPGTESSSVADEDEAEVVPSAAQRVVPVTPAAPSPFTAALARMVAGDQDVRQAVQVALAQPAEERPRDDAEPWPLRLEPVRPADSSVPPSRARQEEETVGDQVIVPPSTTERPIEVPPWAAEPEAAASVSPREEAIADLLRGALAQGHSDEALAGILRKVLAGASPQSALTEPVFAVPAEPVFAVPAEPVAAAPAQPVFAVPAEPVVTAAAEPILDAPAEAEPAAVTPVGATAAEQMWGTPASSTSLWGETASVVSTAGPGAEAPIWADVEVDEPAPAPLFGAPAVPEDAAPSVPEAPELEARQIAAPEIAAPVELSPAEMPAVENLVAETSDAEPPVAEEPDEERAEAPAAAESLDVFLEEADLTEMAPLLARTASDPAPMMSLDATTVMPPLSLLPPLSSARGRGRPPVPPAAPRAGRSSSAGPSAPVAAPPAPEPDAPEAQDVDEPIIEARSADTHARAVVPSTAPATRSLATVTRLPVAPLMAGPHIPELPEDFDETAGEELFAAAQDDAPTAPAAGTAVPTGDVAGRLELLGVPVELLGATFAEDVAAHGTYAALTRSLGLRLPKAPEVPSGAGEAVFVVGPGVDALRAARSLAASLRLDPDRVQWATRGDLAGLAPKSSRVTTVDAAIDRHQESVTAGTVTIVAVDAPMRTDAYWMAQMMTVWSPVAVWAVVEATRKPEDLEPWIDGLPRVDALIVQDTDLSADPAAVLRRVNAPVALLDGVRATPHRWASLLCERLEGAQA
jgi:hypothetical protein